MKRVYRVCEPVISPRAVDYVVASLRAGRVSNGPYVRKFEERFARYCHKKYAVACSSGTAALHLGLLAGDLRPNLPIAMPTFTMAATGFAAAYLGLRMRFVDADAQTWCMDMAKVPAGVQAVVPVHIYGHPVKPCKFKGYVLEDCAEAHGAFPVGWGDAQAYSFYANKIITTGEGGMVTTDSKSIADRVRYYRNMAFDSGRNVIHKFYHRCVGYNYRMTDLQGALGLSQLETIGYVLEKKREIAGWYRKRLKDTGLQLPVEKPWALNVYWMYGVVLRDGSNREEVTEKLAALGVETRPFFCPLHLHPWYGSNHESFPVAERLGQYGFYLPSGAALEERDVKYICEAVRRVI